MSGIFKALKNLGSKTVNVTKTAGPSNTLTMATQVILNNGLKMPRVGRKYTF